MTKVYYVVESGAISTDPSIFETLEEAQKFSDKVVKIWSGYKPQIFRIFETREEVIYD